MQQNYAEVFQLHVEDLNDRVSRVDNRQSVEGFIAAGTQANVYGLVCDGAEYVARIPKYPEDGSALWVDKYAAGMLAVEGVSHFEQIAAISYEESVVIAERMPGVPIDRLTNGDINAISDNQLQELVATLKIAHDRGVRLDTAPANYMYDRTAGFGLIDLELEKRSLDGRRATFDKKIEQTAVALQKIGEKLSDESEGADTQEYYDSRARLMGARIDLLNRFKQAVSSAEMDTTERQRAVERIGQEIHLLRRGLRGLQDPRAVAMQIERAKARLTTTLPTESVPELSDWTPPDMGVKF